MGNPLFTRKPIQRILDEMAGDNRLHRVLGPVSLSSLGVGAIIGTGIFVLTGVAAHDKAGPALMLSYAFAGLACIFAALCYSEMAAMVPVSGSAYTYSYAVVGEVLAWMVGWALVLEYAIAAGAVRPGEGERRQQSGELGERRTGMQLVDGAGVGGDRLAARVGFVEGELERGRGLRHGVAERHHLLAAADRPDRLGDGDGAGVDQQHGVERHAVGDLAHLVR